MFLSIKAMFKTCHVHSFSHVKFSVSQLECGTILINCLKTVTFPYSRSRHGFPCSRSHPAGRGCCLCWPIHKQGSCPAPVAFFLELSNSGYQRNVHNHRLTKNVQINRRWSMLIDDGNEKVTSITSCLLSPSSW